VRVRTKEKIFASFAVCVGLALSLAILEAGLHIRAPAWLKLRMQELNAGRPYSIGSDAAWPVVRENGVFVRFIPGSSFFVVHYEYRKIAHIDSFGGRRTPFTENSKSLVPFYGDSFTFGVGVGDAQTYVSLLAQHSPVRLINLGVPGSSLDRQIDILLRRHTELHRPRLYVFNLFIGNDLEDIHKHARRAARNNETPASTESPPDLWLKEVNAFVYHNAWLKRSYLIQFVRQKLLAQLGRHRASWMNPVFSGMRTDLPYLAEATRDFRHEVLRLRETSRKLGFTPLFVILPDVHQVDPKRLRAKCRYYGLDLATIDPLQANRSVHAVPNDLGIRFVDITSCMARALEPAALYYVQDNHFTVAGHRRAASCLEEQGLLHMIDKLPPLAGK